MAQSEVIKSYLVSLSTSVDQASFAKFANVLAGTEKTVASAVGGIAGNFLKFQVAATTAFATVGFGIVAYIDKLGQADLKTQLLATQNMMGVQQYRAVTVALDTLGVTLNDVFFGTKELQERFHILIDDQKQLALMLGPNYEDQMRQIRDVTFQLQRLEVKAQYFGMKFASDLLEKLGFGKGGILLQLEKLNDFVLKNMPHWSDELSTEVIPLFEDFYDVLKGTGKLAKEVGIDFIHLMGDLNDDDALKNSTGSFKDFAKSLLEAEHDIAKLIEGMLGIEKAAIGLGGSLYHTASGLAFLVTHEWKSAKSEFGKAADDSVSFVRGIQQTGNVISGEEPNNPWDGEGFRKAHPEMFRHGLPSGIYDFVQVLHGMDKNAFPSDNSAFMRLVHGVAQVESGGQQYDRNGQVKIGPDNPSGEHAIGMMQLLPSTAHILGVNPYDPAQNLEGGTRYLAQLLKQHQGNVAAALAEYGGAKSQYSPQGQDYIRKVESAAGIQVGSIIVNVPSSAMTPQQTAQAVKQGVRDGLSDHVRNLIMAHSGAYQ